MSAKKKVKKVPVKWNKGEYVRYNKMPAVITSIEMEDEFDDDKQKWLETDKVNSILIEFINEYGDSDSLTVFETKKLTKIPAPGFVVVWTDENSDPFTQFETKAAADKFVAKKRKDSDVVEVRMYKLIK